MYFSFSVWLISLSMAISRSTHVAANGIISFFFMAEEYFIVYLYQIFFILLMDILKFQVEDLSEIFISFTYKYTLDLAFETLCFWIRYLGWS